MKRDELTELVGSAATACGYSFHTGEERLINGAVRIYPAAWLTPPVVLSHTGRCEGETTLRITLHLMTLPTDDTAPETLWQILEKDALLTVSRLASSPAVCSVSNVGCTPARQSLTVHGETSLSLTCDVTMWYTA